MKEHKKTILHPLCTFCRCWVVFFRSLISALFLYYLRPVPNWNEVLQRLHFPLVSFVLPIACTYVHKGRMHALLSCNNLHYSWHDLHFFFSDPLDEHDLDEVLVEITAVSQVQSLGLALGLLPSAIEKIQIDFTLVNEQKTELIKCWLRRKEIIRKKQSCLPTWSQLVDAVARVDVALSESIRSKHCVASP